MNARQQRGLDIAKRLRIRKTPSGGYIVPSQGGVGKYAVIMGEHPTCTCPDHELHGGMCKHLYAVEYMIQGEFFEDGTAKVTETVRVTETIKRTTYSQNWSAYNAAQTSEKDRFQVLLRDLCKGIAGPEAAKTGRPRLPLADVVFAAAFKVYSTVSGRRFMSDLRDAHARGHLSKVPHFNSISEYLEKREPDPTPARLDHPEQPAASIRGVRLRRGLVGLHYVALSSLVRPQVWAATAGTRLGEGPHHVRRENQRRHRHRNPRPQRIGREADARARGIHRAQFRARGSLRRQGLRQG